MSESKSERSSTVSRVWKKLWVKTLGERHWVRTHGPLREREEWGLIPRPNYAYGLLRAADIAKYFGKKTVTVCEFGVASGAGLLNMIELAEIFRNETGVEFRIVGFDTGEGLPELQPGHKEHPEIWSDGDFVMEDRESLLKKIDGRAELVFGDVAETIDGFVDTLDKDAPLGFVSIDVDIYSATISALRVMLGDPEKYCPAVSCYFDDIGFFFANRWCGELSAIREFNDEHETRKIDNDRSLTYRYAHLGQAWCAHMYVCHHLGHPDRNRARDREALTISAHHEFGQGHNIQR